MRVRVAVIVHLHCDMHRNRVNGTSSKPQGLSAAATQVLTENLSQQLACKINVIVMRYSLQSGSGHALPEGRLCRQRHRTMLTGTTRHSHPPPLSLGGTAAAMW